MITMIRRFLTRRKARRIAERIAGNQWFIACGGPCHDHEFWEREKGYY